LLNGLLDFLTCQLFMIINSLLKDSTTDLQQANDLQCSLKITTTSHLRYNPSRWVLSILAVNEIIMPVIDIKVINDF
jgi:hypothetical protein